MRVVSLVHSVISGMPLAILPCSEWNDFCSMFWSCLVGSGYILGCLVRLHHYYLLYSWSSHFLRLWRLCPPVGQTGGWVTAMRVFPYSPVELRVSLLLVLPPRADHLLGAMLSMVEVGGSQEVILD